MRRILLAITFLMTLFLVSEASARAPLLQEGKKTVYQRLVTHPGAKLYAGAEANAAVVKDPLKTFTVMYIYDRKGNRMEVGTSSLKSDGWIDQSNGTYWPQAITMLFTDRMGRSPVLFFRDHKTLEGTCKAASVQKTMQDYLKVFNSGTVPANFPIIASEPANTAVSEKNFYLLPVLGIDRQYSSTAGLNLLEVASINPGISPTNSAPEAKDLKTGFVFVIDTTISMKPYIKQALDLVRSIYNDLEKNPYGDKMAFAVVAFRNNTKLAPGLGYTVKLVCNFKGVKERQELETALSMVEEATVSTHDFNEDSFAGIKEAVEELDWKNYSGRVMLLVTDAGPLREGDPASMTGMSPEALNAYLKKNNIYLTALHVQTPAGKKNIEYAAESYRTLTLQADNKASYIALDAPTPQKGAEAFNSVGSVLAKSYATITQLNAEGKLASTMPQTQNKKPTPEEEAARIAASTGYAMQLQFMGNQKGNTAPQLVRAWIADADLEKLESSTGAPVMAAIPAVLLTKSQLSRLRQQLKVLVQTGEEAFLRGNSDFNFFEQLRSAAAQISRDPNKFTLDPSQNLMETGMLDEVLADLPYTSVVGGLSQKQWEDMSTGSRQKFLNRLKGLISLYDEYDRDAMHWESFGSPNPDDWVYRVPLNVLP